ncbi:MAG: MFS transporter [Acidobacteriota bacterium]
MLDRLGLGSPELRAWALYDWANSAFVLIVITAIYPIYFQAIAAPSMSGDQAVEVHSWATTITLLIVACFAPVLGAVGDFLGRRKTLMAMFLGIGVCATAAMVFLTPGRWQLAVVLFALGNVGAMVSFVFYDALLPSIASDRDLDRVSTAGYALGYLGSGLLLVAILVALQNPSWFGLSDEHGVVTVTRASFVVVALWWVLFALPLFRSIPEPPRQIEADESSTASALRSALVRLRETLSELRGDYSEAFKMLVAMLVYNDGIGTIIRMATIYAASRNLPQNDVLTAVLLVQFVGVPAAFAFGWLASRITAKNAIGIALLVYLVICIVAYNMETVTTFYLMAILVGLVQGGAQALSRSLFASMIPRHKSAEMFGFFSVSEKFAGIAGPAIFAIMISLTGSSRQAILSVIVFFIVGGMLLLRVDVERGRQQAERAGLG